MPTWMLRVTAAACGIVLVAGVVGAAVHDGPSDSVIADQASSGESTSTTTIAGSTPGASTPVTQLPDDTTPTDPGAADTTPPGQSETAETTPATGPATIAAPVIGTTPGNYIYDTTGTANGEAIDGTSTLEVAAADSDGRQVHIQSAPDGKTTTTYRHAAEGTYLESLALESDQGSFTLAAASPFLLIPAGATTGTTTNGTLQGDGITAAVTFTVTDFGPERTTATVDVDLSGKIQGFDVDGTMNSTIVARSSDRLPVDIAAKSDIAVKNGLVEVFRIKSDTRSVLRT